MANRRGALPFVLLFAVSLVPAVSSGAEAVDAFSQNKKLARSVNIIGYDPIWRSPEKARFTLRHFQLLRAAGFTAVRIDLAPFRAMDAKNNQQLSEAWLKVLDWAVRGALDNNLAVILDCHEYTAMGTDPEGNHERFPVAR